MQRDARRYRSLYFPPRLLLPQIFGFGFGFAFAWLWLEPEAAQFIQRCEATDSR
jgi:hypothetical protein